MLFECNVEPQSMQPDPRGIAMLMPLTADDVVVGILHFVQRSVGSGKKKLSADRQKLHRAFYEIVQKSSVCGTEFTFRNRDNFRESAELDQALSNLDAVGLISRYNLAPRYYVLEKALGDGYSRFSKKILEDNGITEKFLKESARILIKQAIEAAP